MKRKLLFAIVALMCSVGMWAENAYQTYLTTEKGWTQVTDLSSMTLSDYYFAIVSNDNADLMIALDAGVNNTGNHALWYKDAKDPIKDNTYLWIIENNNTEGYVGYTFRNVDYSKRVLQTTDGQNWFCRTNWEQSSARWTSYACTLSDGAYSIQTLANGGSNYLGLWIYANGYVSGQELAGNKSGSEIGKFLFYAIPRNTAQALAVAAEGATPTVPYELGYFLFGRTKNDYTGATGTFTNWPEDNTNSSVEYYYDAAAPSTGDKVSKTITNAPNGYHQITVTANAAWISGRGSVGTTAPETNDNSTVVTINGVSKNVPVRTDGSFNPVTLTFPTYVSDGNITFKMTNNDPAAFWLVWEIKDTFMGTDFTGLIANPNVENDGDVAHNGTVSGWLYNTGASNHGTLTNQTGAFTGHAFENWKSGGLNDGQIYQTLTNLPDGVYKFDLAALVRTVKDQFIYVKSGDNTYRTFLSGDNGVAAAYSVYGIVDGGEMEIGLDINASGIDWCAIDNAALTYLGTGSDAYALVISQENNNVNKYLNTLKACPLKTALSNAQTSYSTGSLANARAMYSLALALDENNAAFVDACNVSAGAASIAAVQHTGEASANSTLTAAISTQASTIAGDLTAVSSATATLRAAIKTYISAAEPANEGEYFDITCLIINPDFDNNDKTGWEGTTPNFGNDATQKAAKGCEFYQKSFDIHQTIEGLPTGSYTLSIYAFQRPGEANAVYNAYEAGSNNVTAKLYVNSDETSVTNIMAAKQSTRLATGGDESGLANNTYWVPNSMVGARAYFDHGLYDATVAALVETGTLNIGFKSPSYVSYDWTIFDEFRLRYYGSSKMIYYKQYLPQLEAEIAENFLNNNAYSILPAGQPEREALETANAADASKLNTEEDLKAAIDAITAARDNFAAAKAAYETLEVAKTAATPELAYASAEKKATLNEAKAATATSLADAQAKTDAITTALRAYYESNALAEGVSGADDCTSKITNPTCPETTHPNTDKYNYSVDGWTTSLIVANKAVNGYTNSNGIEREFYYASHGSFWANDQNSSVATMSQTVTDLEAGKYLLTVCAVVTDGATATLAANGAEQVCTTGASGGVYGKGWNDNSVVFTVGNTGTADISMTMNNNNSKQKWFSFDNFRLVRIGGLDDVTISEEDAQAPTAEAANVTLTRTLKGGQWNGFSVPFGFTVAGSALEGAEVKQFSSVTDNEITMTDATEIVAGEPYLVKPASDIVNPTFSGVSVVAATDAVKGTGDYTFQAHLYATDLATDGSVAYVSTTDSSIKKLTSGSIKGLRSIFNIPVPSTGGDVKALVVRFGDDTDAILSVDAEGNMVDGAIYNVAGQRMSKVQRGVNIVNGKKVLIK